MPFADTASRIPGRVIFGRVRQEAGIRVGVGFDRQPVEVLHQDAPVLDVVTCAQDAIGSRNHAGIENGVLNARFRQCKIIG